MCSSRFATARSSTQRGHHVAPHRSDEGLPVSRVIALALLVASAAAVSPVAAQIQPPTSRPTPPTGAGDTTARPAVLDQTAMRRILGDTSVVPQENQPAGVEAEIRAALY